MQSSFPKVRANARKKSLPWMARLVRAITRFRHGRAMATMRIVRSRRIPRNVECLHALSATRYECPSAKLEPMLSDSEAGVLFFDSNRRRTSVFTGKRFRLSASTLGILSENGERIAVKVLKDAIVEVTSGPRPDDQRMVDVVWEGKTLTMFAQDIRDRGEEVKGKSACKAF